MAVAASSSKRVPSGAMSEVARSSAEQSSPSVPEQNSQGHVEDSVGASEAPKETVKKKLIWQTKTCASITHASSEGNTP